VTRPKNREELLYAAEEEFDKLQLVVEEVPEDLRATPGACEEWSVKDLLAHLDAWHEMFLRWEAVGATGEIPAMPAAGYTWAQTPELNQEIFERHQHDDWDLVQSRLAHSYKKTVEVISCHTNEDLFTKKRFKWAGSTSIGSYAVSATSSHYGWATKLIHKWISSNLTTG
jgi:hypothetical protein